MTFCEALNLYKKFSASQIILNVEVYVYDINSKLQT